jgi:SAM-dependent methyltransferase
LILAPLTAGAQSPPTQPPPDAPPPAPMTPAPSAEGAPNSYPMMGKTHEIMVAENVWIKIGLQAQVWADSSQDSNKQNGDDGGYVNNLFLRRARMLFGMQVLKNVQIFFQTDSPNLGRATGSGAAGTKNLAGFILQDAWGQIKFDQALYLRAGEIIVPLSRQLLASTTTFLTLDVGNTTGTASAATGELNTRDYGVEITGFVLEDHLQYRLGVFSGLRNAPGVAPAPVTLGATNAPRVAAYVQYELFDPEVSTFVYGGQNFGKKKILAISAGFDFQKGNDVDPYYAFSGNVFLDWPLSGEANKAGGDTISALIQYIHFKGSETAPSIAEQNDILAEVAYYNKDASIAVFGKFEGRFLAQGDNPLNQLWFGGGIRYIVQENICNFTLAYNRMQLSNKPDTRNDTNEFTLQMQFYYY